MIDSIDLKFIEEHRDKKAFYASDFLRPDLDLYFGFTGEPITNPTKWNETLKWGAGKGVEMQMLDILKMNGVVANDYDQKEHGRVDIKREGIEIHGYIDAKTVEGIPIEIKSINNANKFDISKYERNYPRENYVGQLAIYMDSLNLSSGYLFVASIDGLSYFWFECKKIGQGRYQCGNVTVDLDKEYKRWAKLYENHIVPKVLPDVWQYRYKHDVKTLDWAKVPKTTISKMRNGHAVYGDYQVSYSKWKDLIVELQGTCLGYSNEEQAIILEKTDGYTTWPKVDY